MVKWRDKSVRNLHSIDYNNSWTKCIRTIYARETLGSSVYYKRPQMVCNSILETILAISPSPSTYMVLTQKTSVIQLSPSLFCKADSTFIEWPLIVHTFKEISLRQCRIKQRFWIWFKNKMLKHVDEKHLNEYKNNLTRKSHLWSVSFSPCNSWRNGLQNIWFINKLWNPSDGKIFTDLEESFSASLFTCRQRC